MSARSPAGLREQLFELNEGPWRWRVGLEAALATGLPLAAFTLAGQQSLGLITSLGTFTALFFAYLEHSERLRLLPFVGAGMILASLIGVLTSGSNWLSVAGVSLVALLACLIVLGREVGPPGPIHFILVSGVSGHLSAPASLGGPGMNGGLVVLLVATGVISSLLVIAGKQLLARLQGRAAPPRRTGLILPGWKLRGPSRWVAIRVISAVVIAGVISLPLGIPRGYWVILAAVAILQASHRVPTTVARAIQRIIGTLLGIVIFALISLLRPAGWLLVLLVSALEFIVELVIARNYGLALLFITPLALIISTANLNGSPLGVLEERAFDTLLGAVIAVVVLFATEGMRRRIGDKAAGQ